MQICAAWLSLLLAGPSPAAPPASPARTSEATQDHIFTVIKESDPEEMLPPRTPRPLSELVEAAELAEVELARATPAEVYELLSLLHDARGLAYRLSGGDAAHLCAELGALAGLMRRQDLEEPTVARVKRLDTAGRNSLAKQHAGHVCGPQVAADETSALPLLVSPPPSVVSPPTRPASMRRKTSPETIAGGVLLVAAGGLAVAVAPVQASRMRIRDGADELRDEVNLAGGATPEQARAAAEYNQAAARTRLATVGLSVSAAALALTGATLVLLGVRQQRRLEFVPQGSPQGAGLLLQGHF